MRKNLALAFFFLLALAAQAQTMEGTIIYEMKINLHRNLPPEREAMKSMIPEFMTQKMQLAFNANESIYKPVEEDDEDMQAGGGRGGGMMRFMRNMGSTYLNFETSQWLELREFMSRKFLIEDTLKVRAWKFEDEEKVVNGYTCKKATMEDEFMNRKVNVVAWYADQMLAPVGPDRFHSLPGTVLEVNVEDELVVFRPLSISTKTPPKNELKAPSEGKKVTRAEFQKIVAERMKEMGGQWNGQRRGSN
ncbi:GLPGLI family protein [Rhodoflexus sp.]